MAFLGVRLGNETQFGIADIQGLAKLAEDQEVWMTEGTGRDSLTQLASIATATSKIVAGTGILPIYSRTPLITAMSAAGLAAVSGGRFILGLEVGNRPATENGHGLRFSRPLDRLREMIYIVRRLLQGEEVTFQGKALYVTEASLGDAAPKEKVPIYIAALGPRMLRLAGEMADGVLLSWTASSYLTEAIRQVREGAVSAGRDPDDVEIAGYVRVAVTDDLDAGRSALQNQVARYASSSHYSNFFRFSGFIQEMDDVERSWQRSAAAAAISVEMQQEMGLVGNAQECRAGLEELRAMGLAKPVVAPLPVGDLKTSYEATIQAMASGV